VGVIQIGSKDSIGESVNVINRYFRRDNVAYLIEKIDMILGQRMATTVDAFGLNSFHSLCEDV
jgi:hypothetical protein